MATPAIPLAFVREWDTSIVRVRCPFCLRVHSHGFGSLDFEQDDSSGALRKRRRAPHCGQIREDHNTIAPREIHLSSDWPGHRILEELVIMAVPLFIVAATVCRFVRDPSWDPGAAQKNSGVSQRG